MVSENRITGKVKWFNLTRGYGFIVRDDGEKDVFVHRSAFRNLAPSLVQEGDAVEFDIQQDPRGPKAANVDVLREPSTSLPAIEQP